MTIDNLESHIEDIINVLSEKSDKKVTRDELEKELKNFMEYGVPIEQAKQTIIKKFGGAISFNSQPSSSSERTLIADLGPNERSVNLLGHVIAINPKEITVKGENRQIFFGILGDESGTIQFTAWDAIEVERGDVIEISNAYTKELQGNPQLNFGNQVRIKKTDKDRLPKSAFEPREHKVKDLRSGLGSVVVTARINEINEREVAVNGDTKKVFSGNLSDETGKAQFTSWHDFKIKEGDVLQISGGYIKSWRGIPQLTFDQNATVKKLDKSDIPKADFEISKMPLHLLIERRGALDVEVEGTVIEIRPGSGLVMRCPECNRTLTNGECSIHGSVEGVQDIRIKLVVDDGTGAVSGVLNREVTEKLLGKTLDECKEMGEEVLLSEINLMLFAHKISMKGNALSDEFGTSFIARDADLVNVDIQSEAEKLAKEMEDLQ